MWWRWIVVAGLLLPPLFDLLETYIHFNKKKKRKYVVKLIKMIHNDARSRPRTDGIFAVWMWTIRGGKHVVPKCGF